MVISDLLQFRRPHPWRVRVIVDFVQRPTVPDSASIDAKVFAIARDGDGIWRVGLQLDHISAGGFCGVDDLHRLIKALVVIGGKLGDDVDGMAGADTAVRDLDLVGHGWCFSNRTDRISSKASAARHPSTLPQRVAVARNASADRGCGNSRASVS